MAGPRVVKTESEPKKKEGIEKVYLPPEQRTVLNSDGTVKEVKTVRPWEIRATGVKYVKELKGIFKESGRDMLHNSLMENKSIGETKITKPDGSVDTVRADKEHLYRAQPGFCKTAVRPTFTCNVPWEGSMKSQGVRRQRIAKEYTETWYHDGRHTIEERKIG